MGEDADDAAVDDDDGEKKRKGKEGPWPLKCTAHSQLGDRQFGAAAPKLKTSQRENCQPGN